MPEAGSLLSLRGVGPAVAERLSRLGVERPLDLLFLLPQRYEDRTRVVPLGSLRPGNGPNYGSDMATVAAFRDGREVARLHPERRVYDVQGMTTTEAGIDRNALRDLYVSLGDPQGDGWALRTYVKSFANWIWGGALMMAAGGVVSLTDRRYRVGAPGRRAARSALAPAPAE